MLLKNGQEIYEYDGSFSGFLCLLYYVFSEQQLPQMVLTPENTIETIFSGKLISTNECLAKKIELRLKTKLGKRNFTFITHGFFTKMSEKERCLLQAIDFGLSNQVNLDEQLGYAPIQVLHKNIQSMYHEAHQYKGFVRFQVAGERLFSTIQPKHFVLPFLSEHFSERYVTQKVAIYDETHQLISFSQNGEILFFEAEDLYLQEFQEEEKKVSQLWQVFFDHVSIKERENRVCQRGHLPVRYRSKMTEFQKKTDE